MRVKVRFRVRVSVGCGQHGLETRLEGSLRRNRWRLPCAVLASSSGGCADGGEKASE